MPVTIHFPNYAFSEHIHMSYIQKWNVFLIKPFSYGRHKNLRLGLLESWQRKKLLPARYLVKFVMLPAQSIALVNWFACMPACMSAIAYVLLTSLLRHWIPNPRVPSSKPPGASKVNSAFHSSNFDHLSTRNSWELNSKK